MISASQDLEVLYSGVLIQLLPQASGRKLFLTEEGIKPSQPNPVLGPTHHEDVSQEITLSLPGAMGEKAQ